MILVISVHTLFEISSEHVVVSAFASAWQVNASLLANPFNCKIWQEGLLDKTNTLVLQIHALPCYL